jgi:hypothetical protein
MIVPGAPLVVSEHRIRLRGGWECDSIDPPAPGPCRLTLPTRWTAEGRRRLRLTRRFHQPPLETGSRVVLRLEHVPGIHSLELNGQPAVPVSPGWSEYEVLLDASASRHRLVLEVETPDPADSSMPATEWGYVSLVIRSEEPVDERARTN